MKQDNQTYQLMANMVIRSRIMHLQRYLNSTPAPARRLEDRISELNALLPQGSDVPLN